MDGGEERLILAAQAGDPRARDELMSDCLPLVYNVVGRALGGHADVDDVVQDTVLRALSGLGGLRDPSRFRSWLVAIAMNQVRRRWTALRRRSAVGLEAASEVADPAGDFVEETIERLGLEGQRREVVEATRWLDPADRELLALWWLEVAGELTRAELASSLGVSSRHAAVRIKRMKEQLETGRSVVRALTATPGCRDLAAVTAGWDGRPAPLWRKRIARHTRGCAVCTEHRRAYAPAEGLFAGLAFLPPPQHLIGIKLPTVASTSPAHFLPGLPGMRTATVAGASAVALTATFAVWSWQSPDHDRPPAVPPNAASIAPTAGTPAPSSQRPRLSPTRRHSPSPRQSSGSPRNLASQVIRLVNLQRVHHGCQPLRENSLMRRTAQQHADDMAARHVLTHSDAKGHSPGDRISAAGFRWSGAAENIAQRPSTPSAVVATWMSDGEHGANILDCRYTVTGVGVSLGSGGPWWAQDFAAPL